MTPLFRGQSHSTNTNFYPNGKDISVSFVLSTFTKKKTSVKGKLKPVPRASP